MQSSAPHGRQSQVRRGHQVQRDCRRGQQLQQFNRSWAIAIFIAPVIAITADSATASIDVNLSISPSRSSKSCEAFTTIDVLALVLDTTADIAPATVNANFSISHSRPSKCHGAPASLDAPALGLDITADSAPQTNDDACGVSKGVRAGFREGNR